MNAPLAARRARSVLGAMLAASLAVASQTGVMPNWPDFQERMRPELAAPAIANVDCEHNEPVTLDAPVRDRPF